MTIFVESSVGTAEGAFACERVDEAEFLPHDHTRCGLFGFLNCEGTIIEAKVLTDFGEEPKK